MNGRVRGNQVGVRVVKMDIRKPVTQKQKDEWLEKLRGQCETNEKGCWLWPKNRNRLGYGQVNFLGEKWMAHRLSWVLARRAIPEGMFVCHTCDTPNCINPWHLFLGDHTTNQRDMIAKNRHAKGKKTECKRGHPLSGDNVAVYNGHRHCKQCERGKNRIKAGWPEGLAYSLPPQPLGYTINPNHPDNSDETSPLQGADRD